MITKAKSMEKFISFDNVSHSYESRLVIDQVCFSLEPKTVTTLVGPNGAGKTTIAKLLLGIEIPKKGSIHKADIKTAYAPQDIKFNSNLPIMTMNFLKYMAPEYKLSPLCKDILDFMHFDKIKTQDVSSLSGGQRQRLLLACAMLKSADLFVLDEPTQALDISSQEEFYSLLDKMRIIMKSTIFIISHDLFNVMKKSDQVLCLNHHICCQGSPTHTVIKGIESLGFYSHHHDHKH